LRSKTKGFGGKTHYIDLKISATIEPTDRELYHLQHSLKRPVRKLLDTAALIRLRKVRLG